MGEDDWARGSARALGVLISGRGLPERDELGRPVEDDDVLLLLNAHDDSVAFRLPGSEGERWDALLDTGHDGFEGRRYGSGATYPLGARAAALLVKPSRRDPSRTDG
jgi:glycogen operon protein